MKLTSRSTVAAALAGVLLISGLAAAVAPATPAAAQEAPKPKKSLPDGKYIVTLRDKAVATYDGGVRSFSATRAPQGQELDPDSRKARSYSGYLADEQKAVAKDAGADISSSYTLAFNGFSSRLTAEQAQKLYSDPRVASVTPDALMHTDADETSTGFLGLSGNDGVWSKIGGTDEAGAGVVIGMIDTGIAPENASFAGKPMAASAGADPWRDGTTTHYRKADGGEFTGACETGEQFTIDDCNTKVIGARYFIDDESTGALPGAEHGEYLSPRDGEGHGSHTASTAAGNNGVNASVGTTNFGTISGVAPAAKIAVYKVCWEFDSGPGCYTGDIISAIDQAVADGVDVINFSIGGGGAQTTVSPTDQAFLGAAAAGIFVSASAGNDGPTVSTADNAAPWETTVAASTIPAPVTTVELGNGQSFLGASISLPPSGTFTGTLVSALANNIPGKRPSALCVPNTLDPAKVTGTIVMCERGVVDRTAKSLEVQRAGGIGMLLVNPTPNSTDLDGHVIPTVHVDADGYPAIKAYAATQGATVTFVNGNPRNLPTTPAPQIAGFSSRGPVLAEGGNILKPDLAAPGVAILADGANASGSSPTYQFLSGTSMAAPHVAGLAALYFGVHPNASPMEVKSTLMTTAYPTVDNTGGATSDVFAQGAGQVDATRYLSPGMVFLSGLPDWLSYIQGSGALNVGAPPVNPSDLNLASVSVGAVAGSQQVTRTVTATSAGDYTAKPVTMPGMTVDVSPSTLHFDAAGDNATFTITFTRTDAPLDQFTTGYLSWTGTTHVVMPLAARPVSIGTPTTAPGTGTSGTTSISVQPGIDGNVAASAAGLARGESVSGTSTPQEPSLKYVFDVPKGTTLAAFVLKSDDASADLDLTISVLSQNHPMPLARSDSPQADETATLENPDPGMYVAEVINTEGSSAFTLTSYALGSSSEGNFAVSPAQQPVSLNQVATVTTSWSGLSSGSTYLGRVAFHATETSTGSEADTSTLVTVTTTGAPPSTSGDPTLSTAAPAALPGLSVAALATGFTPGSHYVIDLDGAQVAKGAVDTSGNASRMFSIPADATYGIKTLTITTSDGTVKHTPFEVAKLVLRAVGPQNRAGFDGSPNISVELSGGGTGTFRVAIDNAAGKQVYSHDLNVTSNPDLADSDIFNSPTVPLPAGHYIAHAWVIRDGTETQEVATPFIAANSTPSTLTLTQAAVPNAVDLKVTDNSDNEFRFQVRYKLCSGPIVSSTYRVFLGENTDTLPLTGIARIDFLLAGKVIGTFANTAPDRCAGEPTFTQPMNVTFTASSAPQDAKAGGDITATMRYQYPAGTASLDLTAGYGPELKADRISREMIAVDPVTQPGPIVERVFSIDEGKQFWINADFEISTSTKNILGRQEVQSEPVTLAMLAPVVGPGDHGNPANPPAGTGNAPASSPSSPQTHLAGTGSDALPAAMFAIALLLAGSIAVAIRRRRRPTR